jgi:ferric-dicitrate binding protein FerR (iron transport regulator)
MKRPENAPEIIELAGAVCDGTATPEQHRRLEELLSRDPEARRLYFDTLDLHLALRTLHAAGVQRRPLDQLRRDLGRLPASRGRRRKGAAFAAAALVGVALGWATLRPSAPAAAAVVSQTAAARFFGTAPAVGSPIPSGREYALASGRVELRFGSGAEAILEGPAVFEVGDAMRLVVKFGKGAVNVPEGAEGFVVETPLTRIVDRGTRFAVDVDEGGETEVQVLEGKAEVLAGSADPALLSQGSGRRYGPRESRDVPFDPSRAPGEMPDRVVRYTATRRAGTGGVEDLVDVTVRRGGREVTYAAEELIGIQLVHFSGGSRRGNFVSTAEGGADPGGPLRAALLDGDRNLNTGVINPGSAKTPLTSDPVMNDPEDPSRPNTPGLAFRFRRPVRNDPGPDVVFFEFQPLIQPETGDPFHVSPLRFAPGLRSHTVRRWDLGTFSPEALPGGFRLNGSAGPVRSLAELRDVKIVGGANWTPASSRVLAVGLDLSDLGFPPGAEVEGLFLQDCDDGGHQVDPTFIAGLPAGGPK